MKYYLKRIGFVTAITLVCCVSLPSEASTSCTSTLTVTIKQQVQVKSNKALCSLQGHTGQHIKKVLADVVETFEIDNTRYTSIRLFSQQDVLDRTQYITCL